jgi:hypothetical protein
MKNFIERVLESKFGLVKVSRLKKCQEERNEYIDLFTRNQKGYIKSIEETKELKATLEKVKLFWTDEEFEEITIIQKNLFDLGLNAEYSDDYHVRNRERELVSKAYNDFKESLKKGIILHDLKNFSV